MYLKKQKKYLSSDSYLPKSKPPNIGEPTKKAIEIIIPKPIPTTIKRIFITKFEIPKIKGNAV